jgi:hypothetical protein
MPKPTFEEIVGADRPVIQATENLWQTASKG